MSQFGIDKFILHLFQGKPGFYIESGSSDPIDQNNTYTLEQNGWRGLLVEPRTLHNEDCKKFRPNSIVENFALVSKSYESDTVEVHPHEWGHMWSIGGIFGKNSNENPQIQNEKIHWPASTLDKILRKHNITEVDFFSLDTEGYEHEVLDGIDFSYVKFNCMLIESHDYTWNGRTNDFSYLAEHGYIHFTNITPNHQMWLHESFKMTLPIQ